MMFKDLAKQSLRIGNDSCVISHSIAYTVNFSGNGKTGHLLYVLD